MTVENTAKYGQCLTCERERSKAYHRKTNGRSMKHCSYRRNYGLTLQEVQALFESQRGLCAVCGQPERSTTKRTGEIKMLHIDHDHKTGKIRGLLCQDCNMALGHLQDSSERIQMLLDYAKAHGL